VRVEPRERSFEMFVRRGPGLVGMAARTAVVAGTATAVSGRVARKQQSKYAEQDAEAMQQQAAAPVQGGAEPDYVEELQQLAKLKEQGIITEEEFEAKKKQALGI
jgi:predicted Zn-dependent peptidase